MATRVEKVSTENETRRNETGNDAVIAALWSAFYLIVIIATVIAPFLAGSVDIALR
ncbi:MAG TPA: hypothetical protein VFS63_15615 [Pseudolabrys sp.]|jgi:hypothetical protein|nr:hypothetical protein [Pseudolabrys sp.]